MILLLAIILPLRQRKMNETISMNRIDDMPFLFGNKSNTNTLLSLFVQAFCLLLFPLSLFAQKIKRSEYDPAKKTWHIESTPVNLKTAPGVKMDAALRWTGNACSLWLSGSGIGANTTMAGDRVIFLLDNDSTVTATSPSVQNVERGSTSYSHEYSLSPEDLDSLSRHNLQGLRKYSANGYDDVYLDKEAAPRLKETSLAFLTELKKASLLATKTASVKPAFPGGKQVLLNFLNRNIKAALPLTNAERKYAVVQFRVAADGSVDDLAIKHSAGDVFDNELLRILKRMPNWKPASQNGKTFEAIVTQPFTFLRTDGRLKIMF